MDKIEELVERTKLTDDEYWVVLKRHYKSPPKRLIDTWIYRLIKDVAKDQRQKFLTDPDLALIDEAYFKYPKARRQRLHVIPLAEALEEKK